MPAGKPCVCCAGASQGSELQKYFNTIGAGGLLSGSLGLPFSKSELTIQCYTKKKGRDGVDLRLNDTTPAFRGNGILNSAVNLFFSPLLQCSFVHDRCCIVPFGRLKSQVQLVVGH